MPSFSLTSVYFLLGSTMNEPSKKVLLIPSSLACGSAGGGMMPGDEPVELAQNQAWDDGLCRCWHADVLDTLDILGAPSLKLEISSDQPLATLCARLVDVFPDGRATLISIGTKLYKYCTILTLYTR